MSNVGKFRNYLKEIDLYMEEKKNENGVFFHTRQSFDKGGTVVVVAAFNSDETLVDIRIFGIANITDPLKKESVHKLMNQLNNDYRFAKFTEFEGEVSINYSYYLTPSAFNPAELLEQLISLLKCAEDSYPKFMKLQWA